MFQVNFAGSLIDILQNQKARTILNQNNYKNLTKLYSNNASLNPKTADYIINLHKLLLIASNFIVI